VKKLWRFISVSFFAVFLMASDRPSLETDPEPVKEQIAGLLNVFWGGSDIAQQQLRVYFRTIYLDGERPPVFEVLALNFDSFEELLKHPYFRFLVDDPLELFSLEEKTALLVSLQSEFGETNEDEMRELVQTAMSKRAASKCKHAIQVSKAPPSARP